MKAKEIMTFQELQGLKEEEEKKNSLSRFLFKKYIWERLLKAGLPLLVSEQFPNEINSILSSTAESLGIKDVEVLRSIEKFASAKAAYYEEKASEELKKAKKEDIFKANVNLVNVLNKKYPHLISDDKMRTSWKNWNLKDEEKKEFTPHKPLIPRPRVKDEFWKKKQLLTDLEFKTLATINKELGTNFKLLKVIAEKYPRFQPFLDRLNQLKLDVLRGKFYLFQLEKETRIYLGRLQEAVTTLTETKKVLATEPPSPKSKNESEERKYLQTPKEKKTMKELIGPQDIEKLAKKMIAETGWIGGGGTFWGKDAKVQRGEFLKTALPALVAADDKQYLEIFKEMNRAPFVHIAGSSHRGIRHENRRYEISDGKIVPRYGSTTAIMNLIGKFASERQKYSESKEKDKTCLREAYNQLIAKLKKNYPFLEESVQAAWKEWLNSNREQKEVKKIIRQPQFPRSVDSPDQVVQKGHWISSIEKQALSITNYKDQKECYKNFPVLEKEIKNFQQQSLSYVQNQGKIFIENVKIIAQLLSEPSRVIDNLQTYILNSLNKEQGTEFKTLDEATSILGEDNFYDTVTAVLWDVKNFNLIPLAEQKSEVSVLIFKWSSAIRQLKTALAEEGVISEQEKASSNSQTFLKKSLDSISSSRLSVSSNQTGSISQSNGH